MEKLFRVYIMASKSRVVYTGITSNLTRRVREHKTGFFQGFSKQYRCTRLVYYETYNTPQRAIAREKEIKGWLRSKKIALIESENPTWGDLAADWFKPIPPIEQIGAADRKAGPSDAAKPGPLPQDDE